MRADRVLQTTDFHTAGIGMRLLTGGLPRLPGGTIAEKRRWFQEHLDDVRTSLCLEPRGHRGLLIAVMTDAVTPGAEFGLFFIYPGGYYVSCGEGTIGAATVAIETGMVQRQGPATRIVIDTEAGPVETIARWENERVRDVTLKWTASFVALADQVVEVEGVGEVPVDIAVGVGNVFAIVRAEDVGVAVRREQARRIAQRGMAVREAVNAQLRVDVPGLGKTSVDNVLVHELPDADGVSPNALVWGPGQVDPAPCGSGTCARMALFHHRGLMRVGSTYVSRGLLGLDFTGRIAAEKEALGLEATNANAGIIAPGHSFAWASPRAPRMLLQSLRGAETAIRLRLTADPQLYAWGLRFLRECTSARARRNTLIKLRLCQYSQAVMNELVRAEGIEYHAITKGAIYLHRDPAELEAGVKKMALLGEHGQRQEIRHANARAPF